LLCSGSEREISCEELCKKRIEIEKTLWVKEIDYEKCIRICRGFSSHISLYNLMFFIASSLFPCTPLGFSSGLGAFRATPETPHLEYLDTYFL